MIIPSSIGPGRPENGFPAVAISGFAAFGDSQVVPLLQPDENYQLVAGVSVLKGSHRLKAGIDLRRSRSARFIAYNTAGFIGFFPGNAGGSGNALADFLLGLPETSSLISPVTVDLRQTRAHLYLADDWTVTSKLTLNLGVRYELNRPLYERYGRIPTVDLTAPGSIIPSAPRAPLEDSRYKNFAPRIGIAYRPFQKTVIRTAYGIFFSEPALLRMTIMATNPPLIVTQNFFSSKENPLQAHDPFPLGLAAAGGVTAPYGFQKAGAGTPYVRTWSFGVQRSVGNHTVIDLSYVGDHAIKMGRSITLNLPQPGPGAIQPRRPLEDFGPVLYYQFDSISNYNSLQARVEKNFSQGLSFLGAYTFSRSIDIDGNELLGSTVYPPNLNIDRGLSQLHAKHRLSLSYVWELPFGPGKLLLNRRGVPGAILGGWQLTGTTLFQSGPALTVAVPGDRANVGLGTRPERVCDGNLSSGQSVNRWFDTDCFVTPALYTFGNSGRGILIGPGSQTWNLGIMKRFSVREHYFVQFRAEMFNAFNHVNLGNPDTTVSDPGFGRIFYAGDARLIQFGLKLGF